MLIKKSEKVWRPAGFEVVTVVAARAMFNLCVTELAE